MIQVHIMELFARQEIYDGLAGKISLFLGGIPAAPVFMLIMGYFQSRTGKKPSAQVLRGLKLIGLGLLLNIGLNLHLLIKIWLEELQINPLEYILGADILFLAGLGIIIIAGLRSLFGNAFYLYFLLALFLTAIHPYLPYFGTNSGLKYLQAFFYGYYHWSYFPLLPWLAYPLTGYAFGLMQKKAFYEKMSRAENYIWAGSLIVSLLTFRYVFTISTNLGLYYHHDWQFFFCAVIFTIFWSISLKKLPGLKPKSSAFKYLSWAGKNVTAFYIVQWLIIGNIATAIYKTQNLWQSLIWFFAITVFTSVIVWLRNKYNERKKSAVI